METNSRKLIQRLKNDGWILVRIRGDHQNFKHPRRPELITVPHPKKDLPLGTVRGIYKKAGWR